MSLKVERDSESNEYNELRSKPNVFGECSLTRTYLNGICIDEALGPFTLNL